MNYQILNIILVNQKLDETRLLIRAISGIKIKTQLTTCDSCLSLQDILKNKARALPHIIILDFDLHRTIGKECLANIRKHPKFDNIIVAGYSEKLSDREIEDLFIAGANVYFRQPKTYQKLLKIVDEMLKVIWQFYSSGLNRENFFLKL